MRIVLASTSRYRKALLARVFTPLGLEVEAVAPGVDESLSPEQAALPVVERATLLAVRKARAVAERHDFRDAIVIGSDQICVDPDGQVLHKPGTAERAAAQLMRLAGNTHALVTAVAVLRVSASAPTEELATACDIHRLTMRALSPEAIVRYVALDQPLDCAGSYKLESLGITLFASIEADPDTADESAIVGLPLMKTLALLRQCFGWDPLSA
jgi:septum formation protein